MSEPLNIDSTKPASSENAELRATCAELESQIFTLRIVLLLAVAVTGLFFWREGNLNGAVVAQMQPQVTQISQYLGQLEKQGSSFEKQMQALQAIAMRLSDFGKTHPDYQPILAKYGIQVAPASSPAPAPATAAAKPAAAAPAAAPKK